MNNNNAIWFQFQATSGFGLAKCASNAHHCSVVQLVHSVNDSNRHSMHIEFTIFCSVKGPHRQRDVEANLPMVKY